MALSSICVRKAIALIFWNACIALLKQAWKLFHSCIRMKRNDCSCTIKQQHAVPFQEVVLTRTYMMLTEVNFMGM